MSAMLEIMWWITIPVFLVEIGVFLKYSGSNRRFDGFVGIMIFMTMVLITAGAFALDYWWLR